MDIKKNLPLILSVINTVLLTVVVVLISVDKIEIGTQAPSRPTPPQRPPLAQDVDMKKLTAGAPVIGAKNPKATIVIFNSFSCGYCSKARVVLNDILQKYGNQVAIAYKHYNRSPGDVKAAMALECAAQQGKHWPMYNTIFEQGITADFTPYAVKIGLNKSTFAKCMADPQVQSKTMESTTEGRNLGITGTPAFVINGDVMVGYRPFEAFEQLLKKYL